jgi:pimeloyl-ACP methyl ester carboxylesterase
MACAGQTTAQLARLYVIDPYRPPFLGLKNISQNAVISSLSNYTSVRASGMITDGTATAIVVCQLGINTPVTFTGTNGLTFAPWDGSFLNSTPATGLNPLPSVQPIQQGNSYYAFALVQAPQQSRNVNYAPQPGGGMVTASLTINNVTTTTNEALGMGPTPVILVHGIWGNIDSLARTEDDLQISYPWFENGSYPTVSAVCYSQILAFDAPGDGGTGCQQTSQKALDDAVTNLQGTLKQNHYVGGRVDLVVHSMGGLVARHYSAVSRNYTTTFSRMQGLFRSVVTIDTPEKGSLLATALMNPVFSNGTCNNPQCTGKSKTEAGRIWLTGCGKNPSTTLAQCMAKNGQPLGPAVASLEPTSPNIASLPPTNNIPNVNWFAIGSDWEDNVGGPTSELRAYFNFLLSAMSINAIPPGFSCSQPPPMLSCLLGDNNNDVIVTTTSQFDNTNPSQVAKYSNLAHAPMPTLAGLLPSFWFTSNANVTDGSVDPCVIQLLLTSSNSGPACPVPQSPQANEAVAFAQESESEVMVYKGETQQDAEARSIYPETEEPQRISVEVPDGDVPLGASVYLKVNLAPGKISAPLAYVQSNLSGAFDSGLASVVNGDDLTKTIKVVPLKLGPVNFQLQTVYSDNAVVQQTVHLNVVPSSNQLRRFVLNQGFSAMELTIDDQKLGSNQSLMPMVVYEGVKYPIYLDDCSQIKLSVEQDESNPVISVDRSGAVHAIREGTALLTGEFAGQVDTIYVTVVSRAGGLSQ